MSDLKMTATSISFKSLFPHSSKYFNLDMYRALGYMTRKG